MKFHHFHKNISFPLLYFLFLQMFSATKPQVNGNFPKPYSTKNSPKMERKLTKFHIFILFSFIFLHFLKLSQQPNRETRKKIIKKWKKKMLNLPAEESSFKKNSFTVASLELFENLRESQQNKNVENHHSFEKI